MMIVTGYKTSDWIRPLNWDVVILCDLFSNRVLLLLRVLFVVRLGVLQDSIDMPVIVNDVNLIVCFKGLS
jgi:hypothetical protein